MTHNLLGDQGRRSSKYNPDLARRINEEIEKEKSRKKREPEEEVAPIPEFQSDIQNKESYILLKGREHGTYEYPDLFVSMHRLGMSSQIEAIGKDLGFTVDNTAEEQEI